MNMKNKKFLQGTLKRHPDGFGFFIPQDTEHPDVFIPAHSMKTAMTNDKVTIVPEKEKDGRYRGDIIRIDERSLKKIAGSFHLINDDYGLIKDEGKGWGKDLKISKEHFNKAQTGQLVVAKILQYPDEGDFTGEIIEIIGDINDALNDIKRVIVSQNIPEDFSPETIQQSKSFPINPTESDFKNRKDLRALPLITIDGATAKDFDDAVYVEMNSQGFHLVVAIADVSHYVKSGTAMDKDAYDRGTSVYFPNFVVPMLPEGLSNGLCSLNPHVPRLALVADMMFDFTGDMKKSHFYEAVIESKARVTYGQAQEIIDQPEGDSDLHRQFKSVTETILRCADLAKVLMAKRYKEGSLDLEVPETELIIDGTGEPIDIVKSERLFAHRLIEEMMLAANVAVAKFFHQKDIPAIYRTHEPPDPLKMRVLEKHLQQFGSRVHLSGEKLQKKLTKALHEFTNETQAQIIHILTLRSMSQAKYTLDNIGHFGLGFDFYTHFTSPIRRYPDLIVHRLIKNCIGLHQYRLMAEDDIQTSGTWLSACEQRSAKAERQIQSIKKARFMKKMLGQSFEGVISSVTKFGVFVLLRQYNTDGLIRIDDLGSQKWVYDEENLKLIAARSGFSYGLGDKIKVIVSSVDIENGQINFTLAEKAQKTIFQKSQTSYKSNDKAKDNLSETTISRKKNSNAKSKSPQSKKLQAIQKSTHNPYINKPKDFREEDILTEQDKKNFETEKRSSPQVIKPKYASLSDYLDQVAKKKPQGKSNNEERVSFSSKKDPRQKPKAKSGQQFSENRKNSEKRQPTENNSGGVRKTRPEKSHRKNKSR